MKIRFRRRRLLQSVATAALLGTASSVALAQQEPQLGGTLNVVTMYRTLDAVTWDFMHWPWKQNHDGLQLSTLIAGDLSKGPGGSNENTFVASDYIPEAHYRGELAESWELKQDPLRLEFKLRKNVFWPAKEGVMERRPLVAADVVASFQEMWKSERRIPTYW
ncbi:MAG TPA: ABC transporter substrate-binding protein, partial [Gammaproteobacteria bacterium]|nr:ABC transporter substrate-binding protein [Gammaproteobacteria bacterium]